MSLMMWYLFLFKTGKSGLLLEKNCKSFYLLTRKKRSCSNPLSMGVKCFFYPHHRM